MRELILQRLVKLGELNYGFKGSVMRWKNFNHNGTHISEIRFESLDDEELLDLFERVVKRHNQMM